MFFIDTYKSSAEIDGGSATNSKSFGGSFGTNCCSVTCFSNSCCFCATEEIDKFFKPGNAKREKLIKI